MLPAVVLVPVVSVALASSIGREEGLFVNKNKMFCCDDSSALHKKVVSIHDVSKKAGAQNIKEIEKNNKFPSRLNLEEMQEIRRVGNGLFWEEEKNETDIINILSKYSDNPEKHANAIVSMLENSSIGFRTNEAGIRGGVYSINRKNYPFVVASIEKNFSCSLEDFLASELSDEETKDLFRHLNQFKK